MKVTSDREPLPKFSVSQKNGRLALRCLNLKAPTGWLVKPLDGDDDLGLDLNIQILDQRGEAQFPVRGQVKGITEAALNQDGTISVALRTETLNYYLRTDEPILLIVVSLPREEGEFHKGRAYFCWAQDEARKLLQEGETFFSQQSTYTLRVSTENEIHPDLNILPELQKRLDVSRSLRAIETSIDRSLQSGSSEDKIATLSRIDQHIKREGVAYLELAELDTTAVWPEAAPGTYARDLDEAAGMIKAGDYRRAERYLERCHAGYEHASVRERAEYKYLRGRIAALEDKHAEATKLFEEAITLQPGIEKYRVGVLEMKFSDRFRADSAGDYADILQEAEAFKTSAGLIFRSRVLAGSGALEHASRVLESLPDVERAAGRALVLFLQGQYEALLTYTERVLRTEAVSPRMELLVQVFRARSLFHLAIPDSDGIIPPFGRADTDIERLHEAWAVIKAALTLADRLSWPEAAEWLFDIVVLVSSALEKQREVLNLVKAAATARKDSKEAQLCYLRLCRGADDHARAGELARELARGDPAPHHIPELVLTLYECGLLSECIDAAKKLSNIPRLPDSSDLTGTAFAVATLAAQRLARHGEEMQFSTSLNTTAQWSGEAAVLGYVQRISRAPLEAKAALQELKLQWDTLRHKLIGLHLLRDADAHENTEAAWCVEVAEEMLRTIKLGPQEIRKLAQAYATLHRWDALATLAQQAIRQFAEDDVLRGAYALALDNLGQTNEALRILQALDTREKFPVELYANIATRCGLADQAIRLLELLLEKEGDGKNKLMLLRSLYTLEFERDPKSPRVLELVCAIGQTVDQNVEEEEGPFLVAFVTATLHEQVRPSDTQVREWQERCASFASKFPRSHIFRMMPAPESLEDFEETLRKEGLLEERRSPELLKLERGLRRGTAVPYCWRPRVILRNVSDVAHLWALTKVTREAAEYELLLSTEGPDSLDGDIVVDRMPLIDLTTLLVLADLDILDRLFQLFARVAITKTTVLQLRNLAHPLLGGYGSSTAGKVIETLRRHLSGVEQPGGSAGKTLLADLNRKREDDQLELLRSERYAFCCDDAIYVKFVESQVQKIPRLSTLHVLVLADRLGVLSANEVAKCIASLCAWNIGRVIIPGRYFVASIPAEAVTASSRQRVDALLEASPARKIYDAVWSPKRPYIDVVRHIGWLIGYMVTANPNLEQITAVLLHTWYVKAKLREERFAPPLRHLVYAIASALRVRDLDSSAIHRLWSLYLKVVEWDAGNAMSLEIEDRAIGLMAEVLCFSGAKDITADERLRSSMKAFQKFQSGLTSGTREFDVFRAAYERAQARLERELKTKRIQ